MAGRDKTGPASGAFWSGTITFGLVSIHVDLFSAHRQKKTALRMVDRQGIPLQRRYFCPRDNTPLEREEIVRGYEIEEGKFILVDDDELEALEPKKTREIDLRSFVETAALDPVYFDKAYFLLPAGGIDKPYRLLAQVMERSGMAGIATFVMRAREHLVAIIAEDGILRAETLRFVDEIRSPENIGLPAREKAPAGIAKQLRKELRTFRRKEFDPDQLHDRYAGRLLDLVEQKRKSGRDVVEQPAAEKEGGAEIIDLMEIIKQRFQEAGKSRGKQGNRKIPKDKSDLAAESKSDLYSLAQQLNIQGRSSMTKEELIEAIAKAS